jgi:hypothetical protein
VLVTGTISGPTLTINSKDQSDAGDHVYNLQYTNYFGNSINLPMTFSLIQTACRSSVSGLETVSRSYIHNITSLQPTMIDIGSVLNFECGYSLELTQLSGPATQDFMVLV